MLPQNQRSAVGFVDANRDGVNDGFADADGDGTNDVTGRPYLHSFGFQDENGDGKNDLWADADGDGVNDLLGRIQKAQRRWIDRDGDGMMDEEVGGLRGKALKAHVLDADADGRNDITGEPYTGRDLGGYRYGRVDEENGVVASDFVDEDGNGTDDRFEERGQGLEKGRKDMDLFIDTDGDGIADGRGLGHLKGKGKGEKKGKK